ncbi:MAG: hypothetical protein KIS79_05780 [Burkholderiales bacterium]|nr:hypothetical protein [Burkholderiales bacterium]
MGRVIDSAASGAGTQSSLHAMRWYLRRGRDVLGRYGMLGLALLVAAAVVFGTRVLPEHAALMTAKRELSQTAIPASRDAALQPVRMDLRTGLDRFYGQFPPATGDLELLEQLYRAAAQAGVELDKANYELIQAPRQRLVRYRVDLPVRAEYLQIRRFVQSILEDLPNLALEQVSFRRTEGDGRIQCVLALSLYLRRE